MKKSLVTRKRSLCYSDVESSLTEGANSADDEPDGCSQNLIYHGLARENNRLFSNISDILWNDWHWQFRNRITSVTEIAKYLSLSSSEQEHLKLVTHKYPLAITPYYLSLITSLDKNDPIRVQSIPAIEEIATGDFGFEDPLTEKEHEVTAGLIHRYRDRVLMVLTDVCPMFCRHCTRKREWQHGNWVRKDGEINAMLGYIRQHSEVRDVIISGGDPLTLSTSRLESVIASLRKIPHVEIIRIGTRCPVVMPQRIDQELTDMLSKHSPIWVNTHFNHVNEITPEAAAACDRLLRCGVPVNNQSVLLRGVNDTVESQLKLCEGLLRIKVRPYYLFEADEVLGTEHLRTPVQKGIDIIRGMRGRTSGFAIPTFVIDLPQGGGKIPIQPEYVISRSTGELVVQNCNGKIYHFRDPLETMEPKHELAVSEPVEHPQGTTTSRFNLRQKV